MSFKRGRASMTPRQRREFDNLKELLGAGKWQPA